MNNRQIEKGHMYEKEEQFFKNPVFNAIWANFKRLNDEIVKFIDLRAQFVNYIKLHLLDTTEITAKKNKAFRTMVETVINKADKAYVWAFDSNNTNLMKEFDIAKYDFELSSQTIAFGTIKNIRDSISLNIGAMEAVNLFDADVSELNDAIAAYETLIGTPGTAKTHKQANTKGIEDVIHPIDESLDLISRLIESQYSKSNPKMVEEFLLNKQIDKLPTHHSGVSAHISDTDSKEDLQTVVMSIIGIGKTAISDINGHAEIIKIKNGDYNVIFNHNGYVSQSIKVTIIRGKIIELAVEMKKNEKNHS